MRGRCWVALTVAAVAPLVVAADPPAPPPGSLKADVTGLAREREEATRELTTDTGKTAERLKLRADLDALLKKLADKPRSPAPPPKAVEPAPTPKAGGRDLVEGIDHLREARNWYLAGDIESARQVFDLVMKSEKVSREDRLFAKYMTACCLRRQGKLGEAGSLYREVAETNDDKFLADSARWQLGTLKSLQELESQLEVLRARRKSQ